MKTLADFKRRLTPSTKVEIANTRRNATRTASIVRVRSKDFSVDTPSGQESFIDFNKASDWTFSANSAIQSFGRDQQFSMTFTFV